MPLAPSGPARSARRSLAARKTIPARILFSFFWCRLKSQLDINTKTYTNSWPVLLSLSLPGEPPGHSYQRVFCVCLIHAAPVHSMQCTADLNCSLNGGCIQGACICDKPWSGPRCETMNFQPVAFPQGYGMRNASVFQGGANTSWGGNVLFDGKMYHLYLNTIANECLLGMWMRNSRIDHVVSDVITGPYTFKDTAVGMWSSNPAPVVLKSGPFRYAMFMIGNGTALPGIKNCSLGTQNSGDQNESPQASPTSVKNAISVSSSLD